MFSTPQGAGAHVAAGRLSLEELVARVRALGEVRERPQELSALLLSRPLSWESVHPYVRVRRGAYARTLVHRDAQVEVLVLAWSAGAASPIHGHDGQACWLVPVWGQLLVQGYRALSGGQQAGPARLVPEGGPQRLGPGRLDLRHPEADWHQVRTAPGVALAVAVHIYARPIDTCLVYDAQRGRCARRCLAYDGLGPVRR
jgi:NitT/TauT family transport system ATP-binding protein